MFYYKFKSSGTLPSCYSCLGNFPLKNLKHRESSRKNPRTKKKWVNSKKKCVHWDSNQRPRVYPKNPGPLGEVKCNFTKWKVVAHTDHALPSVQTPGTKSDTDVCFNQYIPFNYILYWICVKLLFKIYLRLILFCKDQFLIKNIGSSDKNV